MTHPNPVLAAIFQRRSVRKYTDQAVETEKLEVLLQAAMAAPSAMNCKPWEFVVITDAAKLEQCRKRLIFGNRNAPAAILVCGNPEASANRAAKHFWVQDCSAATQNILLAAHSMGLCSCLIGFAVVAMKRDRSIQRFIGIPAEEEVHAVIALGYSDEVYQRVAGRKKVIPRYFEG